MKPTCSYHWDEKVVQSHITTPSGTIPAYSALFHYELHKQMRGNRRNPDIPGKESRSTYQKCDYNVEIRTPQYLEQLEATHDEIRKQQQIFKDVTIADHVFEIPGDCGRGSC